MKIRIKVKHDSIRKYAKFCALFHYAVKKDMINRLDPRKFIVRKSFLDQALSVNLDYYSIYKLWINTTFLRKEEKSEYYCIYFDTSIKVGNYRVDDICRVIEYGVIGLEPYPFMRLSIDKYSKMLPELYKIYCKEGKIDLSLRRGNNRRPQGAIRR